MEELQPTEVTSQVLGVLWMQSEQFFRCDGRTLLDAHQVVVEDTGQSILNCFW